MEGINWKKKLTSRKFWAAVAGFVGPLLIAFGASEDVATEVTALIMSGAAVIAYIIGEGLADAANSGIHEAVLLEEAKEVEAEVE